MIRKNIFKGAEDQFNIVIGLKDALKEQGVALDEYTDRRYQPGLFWQGLSCLTKTRSMTKP